MAVVWPAFVEAAMKKLVSVVTGTYNRPKDLAGAIDNVRAQSYRPLEHVIVHDGPDARFARGMGLDGLGGPVEAAGRVAGVPIKAAQLGRNWSTFLTNSHSVAPFMVAQMLAAGDYQVWMSDDERFLHPDAIADLVDLLEAGPYDFVSSLVEVYLATAPDRRWVVGGPELSRGSITHALYRAELLDSGMFRPHVGSGSDWDQVERWVAGGARYGFLPKVGFSHRSDYMHREQSSPLAR